MDKITENKKTFIISFIYICIVVGLYYCFFKFAFGYIFPFLVAAVLAMVLQKPIGKLENRFHIKAHGPISFVIVLIIILLIFLVLTIVGIVLFNELKDFFTFLFSQFSSIKDIVDTVEDAVMKVVVKLPAGIKTSVGNYVTEFFTKISSSGSGTAAGAGAAAGTTFDLSSLSAPLSGAWNVVKGVPSMLLSVLVTIISCFFMTIDYVSIKELFLGMFSEEKRKKIVSTKRTTMRGMGKLFKAYATIMLITFSEMFFGLYLMKLIGIYESGYIAVIALVTCVVDIVPVLGTGTVLIPWALYCLFFDNFSLGIALIVLYAVITVLRQIIEPKLVANQVGLPAIVTIMAMFLGAKLFGTFGIIILPFTVIILKLLYDEGVLINHNAPKRIVADVNAEDADDVLSEDGEKKEDCATEKKAKNKKFGFHKK